MFQEDSCYVKKHRPMSVEAGPVRHFRKIDRLRIHIGNDYAPCICIHPLTRSFNNCDLYVLQKLYVGFVGHNNTCWFIFSNIS